MIVHAPTQSLLFKAPDPFLIRGLLPKSRTVVHPDYNIACKHTLASTKVLRNIGIDAPAPILSQYDWPGKFTALPHQKAMAEFLTMNRRAFNLSQMGTMKTAPALWAADWLMKQGSVHKALILSPLSTLERVWGNEIFDVLMHRICAIVHGSKDQREKALATDADFYILNHDGVGIKWLRDAIRKRPDIDLVIVDEGSMFRNHDVKKFDYLSEMIRPDQRVWWLTGTPCPNSPTDAWAQVKIINPTNVPKFFGAFQRLTMYKESQFKWSPKPEAYKIAHAAMQPAIRFLKKDCIDLPPVTVEKRQAELTPEQKVAFKNMQLLMIAEAKQTQITAVNAADKIGKLRQILCGAIKDPVTEDYITLPHAPRLSVLMEAIEGADAKVIVIVPFKGIIQALEKEIGKKYSVAVLNGDVSPKRRDQIIRAFKSEEHPHVLLCHPKVMAHGLNLTEADVLIFYAPIYSNDEFEQVIERFNRAGQINKMTIVKIGAHRLEWDIYAALEGKRITQDNILKLYQSVIE